MAEPDGALGVVATLEGATVFVFLDGAIALSIDDAVVETPVVSLATVVSKISAASLSSLSCWCFFPFPCP